jgi:hypothetical protein
MQTNELQKFHLDFLFMKLKNFIRSQLFLIFKIFFFTTLSDSILISYISSMTKIMCSMEYPMRFDN